MPISRQHVRGVCTRDEYEVYYASLRLRLPGLRASELKTFIRRAREFVRLAELGSSKEPLLRRLPRKADLLSGALSRFEGRLRLLSAGKARRNPAGR